MRLGVTRGRSERHRTSQEVADIQSLVAINVPRYTGVESSALDYDKVQVDEQTVPAEDTKVLWRSLGTLKSHCQRHSEYNDTNGDILHSNPRGR